MGGPSRMTRKVIAKLEEAFALSCTDLEARFYAGIAPVTNYNYQESNQEFVKKLQILMHDNSIGMLQVFNEVISTQADQSRYYKAFAKVQF